MSDPVEDITKAEGHATGRVLLSPERDPQRGRKRRRSPLPFTIVTTNTTKTLSGESATFRGRQRYRSTSLITLSAFSSALPSRNPSRSFRDASYSPTRKRYFPLTRPERRRSQSPSRSRSPNATTETPKRRRQRTRSRSRDHHGNATITTVEITSPLRVEVVTSPKKTHGKEK